MKVSTSAGSSFALIGDVIRDRSAGDDVNLDQKFIKLSEFASCLFSSGSQAPMTC
jgi:hypothetical protein